MGKSGGRARRALVMAAGAGLLGVAMAQSSDKVRAEAPLDWRLCFGHGMLAGSGAYCRGEASGLAPALSA